MLGLTKSAEKKVQKLLDMAEKAKRKGNLGDAIEKFEMASTFRPDDPRIFLKLADLWVKRGIKTEAIAYYRKAAIIYSKDSYYFQAVAVYKQALGLDEERTDIREEMAGLYEKLGLESDAGRERDFISLSKRVTALETITTNVFAAQNGDAKAKEFLKLARNLLSPKSRQKKDA